ncbi:LOW QUALITY PROTEIN: hypothetical protein Cgig2_007627 [Carnegiea gigantea]|uniref:Uncharacterized protein n=1 Tax=Carnegiea gigantea TaxID=171969 RepID=A0A9Q1GT01_9CARY|nr:LOW QUALITY PROTEIN: hypothetical protein Cgig2_007627 [Carnegiea gigantea]
MPNYVRETFIWRWRSASRPPRPLPEDFHVLCPRFSLAKAEDTATEFEIPKMATFYATLLNEAFKLGMAHEYTAESMKSSLVGLRWSTFEVWLDCIDCVIREAHLYCPADEWRSEAPETARRKAQDRSILRPLLVRWMAKTKSTPCIRSPDKLLAEGTLGNPSSAPPQSNPEVEVAFTSSSASSGTGSSSSSSGHSSRSSSLEWASTSTSSHEASLGPGESVLRHKGHLPLVIKIVDKGSEFPRALTCSNPQDGPGSHFPDPKVVTKLKRSALEKQYLFPSTIPS